MINDAFANFVAQHNGGRHRTLAEDAYAMIHEAICTGRLPPGERLPIEALGETMRMSPMPIREALRRLHAGGLVENIPHRGASVTKLSLEDLTQIYDARLALEPLAVQRAAERFTDEDEARARAALGTLEAKLEDADEVAAWAAHTAFHFALYEPSRSEWLLRLITPLWESSERYRLASSAKRSMRGRNLEHLRILEACSAHDAERAARELQQHLVKTANAVCKAIGGGPQLFAARSLVPLPVASAEHS